jgi:hypothetical protein
MPRLGQPTKLTPERARLLIDRLSNGVPIAQTCSTSGISVQTHYNWLERGTAEKARLAENPRARPLQGERIYVDYLERVEKAKDQAFVRMVAIVQSAATGGREIDTQVITERDAAGKITSERRITRVAPPIWQAAAWWLERRHPEQFARTYKAEHTGKDGGPIQSIGMTPDEHKAFLAENMSRVSHLADVMLDEDDLV